jgi:hypothetical protein
MFTRDNTPSYFKFNSQSEQKFESKSTEVISTEEKTSSENVVRTTRMPTQKVTRKFKFISNANENELKSASESNLSLAWIKVKPRRI